MSAKKQRRTKQQDEWIAQSNRQRSSVADMNMDASCLMESTKGNFQCFYGCFGTLEEKPMGIGGTHTYNNPQSCYVGSGAIQFQCLEVRSRCKFKYWKYHNRRKSGMESESTPDQWLWRFAHTRQCGTGAIVVHSSAARSEKEHVYSTYSSVLPYFSLFCLHACFCRFSALLLRAWKFIKVAWCD